MSSTSRLVVRTGAHTLAPRKKALPLVSPAPFVKWVGGKTRLLPELAARAPRTYRRYFEPFVGGGALFFHLRPRPALLSDLNADLVETYRAVKLQVEQVIKHAMKLQAKHCEAHYYATRDEWNELRAEWSPAERAATFLYLNKTCYNGLWRVNRSGGFNVPAGRYTHPQVMDPEVLRATSACLEHAELVHAPFEHVLEEADAGDFVYFDPPYVPVSATADFTSYTGDGFDADDQARLARTFRALADRGCAVMLSNSDTPLVHRLYAGFRLDKVRCARAINSRADKRGEVDELVVTNRY